MWLWDWTQRQPSWAREMEKRIMANVQEKIGELTTLLGTIKTSIDGIKGDAAGQAEKLLAQAQEIEALKAEVVAAQGGELSEDNLARFDALIASTKELAETAKNIDDQLPNIEAPTPTPPADGGGTDQPQG